MKNKTCGEGTSWNRYTNACVYHELDMDKTNPACGDFTPITNGDVIRQGGNHDFAEYFVYETGTVFASTLIVDKTFDTYEEATKATEDYLNAPADCQLNDAIQNVIKDGTKNAIDIHEAAYAPDIHVAPAESEGGE